MKLLRLALTFLAGFSLLRAQSTSTTGSAFPASFGNVQPSLALRAIVVAEGASYPNTPDAGLMPYSGDDTYYLGEIHYFAGFPSFNAGAPNANGQVIPISSNAALFSLLGTHFGGNGASTFALPDLRGRAARHLASEEDLGQLAGTETKSLLLSQLPAHTHGYGATGPQVGQTGAPPPDNSQPFQNLRYLINGRGEVRLYCGFEAPNGWTFCEGQILNSDEFPELAGYLGTTFGGTGSTFALPDLRGRILLGTGLGNGLTNRSLGPVTADTTPLTVPQLPAHTHDFPAGSGPTGPTGTSSPFGNMQASHGLIFAIVTSGIYPSPDGNPFVFDGQRVLGEILIYATPNLPSGLQPCNGQLLPINQNQALFSLLGTTFGGNGQTTFALPDLRGRTPVGDGSGPGLTPRDWGSPFGVEAEILTVAHLPAHSHPLVAAAAAIPNPSFETDTFTLWPGYAGVTNGPITGWSYVSGTGGVGLNPAGTPPPGDIASTFANNGAVPQGSKVAFVQSNNNTAASLSTTVYGLSVGTSYTVGFRTNRRHFYGAPSVSWSLNGSGFIPCVASPDVGGTNPYYSITGTFTATSPLATITVRNQTPTDTTVLLDAFTLTPAASPAWTVSPWTDDSTSGLTAGQTAWAYHFNSAANTTVNTVPVTGLTGTAPAVSGRFSVQGFPFSSSDTNGLTSGPGGSAVLAASFLYGANPGTITFEGLTPGRSYRATFLSVGWDTLPTARTITLGSPNDSLTVDQNKYDNNNGIRLDHTFTASAATHTVTLQPAAPETFHLYALALTTPLVPDLAVQSPPGNPVASPLDFGPRPISSPPGLTQTLTFANNGLLALNLTGVSLTGANAAQFTLNTSGLLSPVPPGGSTSVTLTYAPIAAGPHNATLRILSDDPDQPTLDLPLSGQGKVLVASWKQTEFGVNASNPAIAGDNADPDGDGLPNLLEYALRSNPQSANLGAFAAAVAVTLPGPVEARQFTFPYRATSGDLSYVLQRATVLGIWTDAYRLNLATGAVTQLSGVSGNTDANTQTVTVTITDLSLFDTPYFWRLKAEAP